MNLRFKKSAGWLLALLLLAALWGASFLFMRVAAPAFGPVALIEVRVAVAALTLLPLVLARSQLTGMRGSAGRLEAEHAPIGGFGSDDVQDEAGDQRLGFLVPVRFARLARRVMNQRIGVSTSDGNSTSRTRTKSSAQRKGHRPFISSPIEIFETPQMTLSTMPTGGVIRPMALFMMNSTPK